MNCAEFERGLSRLLAGDEEEGDRERRLAGLRGHAEACAGCGGLADLLELLSLPPGERDLAEGPPAAYWEGFEAGLRDKLARGGSPRGRGWAAWAGLAAALLLAGVGLWLVFSSAEPGPAGQGLAARDPGPVEIPESLEALLRSAEPGEALAGLDFLGGFAALPESADPAPAGNGPAGSGAPFYPDPEAMDAESRRALLEWLREQEDRGLGVES